MTKWSRSNLFFGGALALVATLLALRLFLHSVSVLNRSHEIARVTCGPFVSVVLGTKESRYLMYSLWGTSMNCLVHVGGHPVPCSADMAPFSTASVEITPTGRLECRALN